MLIEQLGQTSSMGVVWPPIEYTNERLRGFYTESVVRSKVDSAEFASTFAEQRARFEQSANATRLSIRFVAHAGQLATLHALGVPLEGALPLFNTEDDLCIVYAGVNTPDRKPNDGELAQQRTVLHNARNRPRHNSDIISELEELGMQAHAVDRTKARELLSSFKPLYSAFGYSEDDTLDILHSEHNHIIYITDDKSVVSTAMVEVNEVSVAGLGSLKIGEITDAYTLPSHRGRGLYRCASRLLVDQLLAEQGDDIHCLYGESNLSRPGVIYAGHENGRNFVFFDEHAVTITNFGILPQNVRVNDGPNSSGYNNFALSYVLLEQ